MIYFNHPCVECITIEKEDTPQNKMYLRKKQFIKSNVRSSQIYIMIIFVIFSIQILMRTVSSESCDKLFPKDNGLTMVKSIRQGSDLNNYLSGTYTFEKRIDYYFDSRLVTFE